MGTLHSPQHFAQNLPVNQPLVFVVGAMATGSIKMEDHPYVRTVFVLNINYG